MTYVRCIDNTGYEASLTAGAVYKALPTTELERGSLRVIDNSGEDYLYDPRRFEPIEVNSQEKAVKSITVHVPEWFYGILHAEAVAADKPISAFVREALAERLDLSV
jgi:hypothetical protein